MLWKNGEWQIWQFNKITIHLHLSSGNNPNIHKDSYQLQFIQGLFRGVEPQEKTIPICSMYESGGLTIIMTFL